MFVNVVRVFILSMMLALKCVNVFSAVPVVNVNSGTVHNFDNVLVHSNAITIGNVVS